MIERTHIVDAKSNLRLSQDSLDRGYLKDQADSFKIDYALVYHIASKMFTDTNASVYMKQRKNKQDSRKNAGWSSSVL